MNDFDAVMICEGCEEPDDLEHLREAWQHLVNRGMAWELQGFFGRTASDMIDAGFIEFATLPEKQADNLP